MDVSKGKRVLKFETDTCGACKAMEPTWKKLQEKNIDKNINFHTIRAEKEKELFNAYGVTAVPTFIAMEDGKVIKRMLGINPEKTLQTLVDELK